MNFKLSPKQPTPDTNESGQRKPDDGRSSMLTGTPILDLSQTLVNTLICKGWTREQIQTVATYLKNNFTHQPSPKTLVRNFATYLNQSQTDPIATGVTPDEVAIRVAKQLSSKGDLVPPEYVMQSLQEYRQVAKVILQKRSMLWYSLPHPSEFVYFWYTELATWGTPQYRRFHAEHPAWRGWLAKESAKLGYNP